MDESSIVTSGAFESLPGAVDPGAALGPMESEDTRVEGDPWSDETALKVVLQDAAEALAYLSSKGLVPLGIENADDLVRAYVRPRQWSDGKPRANLPMYTVLEAVEKVLPALYLSLFGSGKKEPFIVAPAGRTTPEAARANAALLAWAFKQANLKEEMRIALKTALTYGWVVTGYGWESRSQRKKIYEKSKTHPDGRMIAKWEEEDLEIPTFEVSDPRCILVDPQLARQDVQNGARYVIKQIFITGYDLPGFRGDPAYKNIPTDAELIRILPTKAEPTTDEMSLNKRAVWREFQAALPTEWAGTDPMAQPLEILEYTTPERVVSVLQRKIPIRNQENEFNALPFHSCAFVDVLGSAWGFGIARLLAGEQRLQVGVVNNWIDSLALTLNPVFQLLKGIGPGTQNITISPGKVVDVSGELKPLVAPDVTRTALEAIADSRSRAEERVGANGGSSMPTQAMRTAQGVNAFATDVIQRLQYFLEIFINLIYLPTLESFLALMRDHLTVKQINSILTEAEGEAYTGDIAEVYNATVSVDVIAGANMVARYAASQLAPLIVQLISSGPVAGQFETQGKYFDYVEFISETLDLNGWDLNDLILDMTPEMKQNVQLKNTAMQRAAGNTQLAAQQHENALSEIDAKASGQAGVAVIRSVLKGHMAAAQDAMNATEGQNDSGQPLNGQ